jgi:hypothetical protein
MLLREEGELAPNEINEARRHVLRLIRPCRSSSAVGTSSTGGPGRSRDGPTSKT